MRVRSCDNPPPSKEGRDCVGHNTQKVDCKSGDCCKYKSEENILSNLDNLLVSEEPGRILNNFRYIHFALKSAVLFQSYSICIPWILIASFPCGDFSTVYKPSAYLSKLRRHLDKYASSTSFNGLVLFKILWSVARCWTNKTILWPNSKPYCKTSSDKAGPVYVLALNCFASLQVPYPWGHSVAL